MHVEVVCSYDSRLHENGLFSDCSIKQIVNTYLHDKVDMIRSFLKRKKKNSLEREKKNVQNGTKNGYCVVWLFSVQFTTLKDEAF